MDPQEAPPPDDGRSRFEDVLAVALLLGSFAFALVVQSALFYRSDSMLGDITYHRGVAYTMVGGDVQGEGPYAGLLSYYGGLYPLGIGTLAALLGTTFDRVLGPLSWPSTLLLPLAFLLLGRRLWPARLLPTAILVLLATTAAPWARRPDALWVESVLPSGSSFWPVFPRDVALGILVAIAWALLARRSWERMLVAGVLLGVLVLFHAQLALFGVLLVGLASVARAVAARSPRAILEGVGAGALAAAMSAWWWIPRLGATIEAGPLLLADHPSRLPLRIDPTGFVTAFGIVGVLAVVTALALPLRRRLPSGTWFAIAWIGAVLPLIALDRLGLGGDLFSERRAWLVASIGLAVLSTIGAVAIMATLRRAAVLAFIAVVLVAPSIPGTNATVREVRGAWQLDAVLPQGVTAAAWRAVTEELRTASRDAGRPLQVGTYDTLAAWTWSFSGAQVPSLWLAGYMKLGFDPEVMTGQGYLSRVDALDAAFDRGLPGLCELAAADHLDRFLLGATGGLVATHDRTAASPYRVEPRDRDASTLERWVAPGILYRDLNRIDVIQLYPGGSVVLPWTDATVRRVGLLVRRLTPDPGPSLRVTSAGSAAEAEAGLRRGWVYLDVNGIDGVTIEALAPIELLRIEALAPWPAGDLPVQDGLFLADVPTVCGP